MYIMKIKTSSYRSHILLATVTLVFPLLGVVHPSLPMQAAENPDISSIVSAFTAGEEALDAYLKRAFSKPNNANGHTIMGLE
jgi:hypothetical protein